MTPHPRHFRADLHEAKDLRGALARLAPAERVRWLRLCCRKVSPLLDVVRSAGSVKDVLADFYSICGQGGLTLEWAQALAEHLLRGREVRELLGDLQWPSASLRPARTPPP